MSAIVIDGKAVAAKERAQTAVRARAFAERCGRPPGLAVVQVGDDPASTVYVRNKRRSCVEAGIESFAHDLPGTTTQAQLLELLHTLNRDPRVDGILVQMPLPKSIDSNHIIDAIDPAKDVDGLHPINEGLLAVGRPGLRACTPSGCMRLLAEVGCDPSGKRAIVVGRSILVGKPMAFLLLEANATVTIAHSRTRDLAAAVREADIVVAAVGREAMIKGEWIKPGAVVIDVGTNKGADGKLKGDVEFESASRVAAAITPVPGGVGPMTIAMLLANTVEAAYRRAGLPLL
ncbi:MAG TPA: bifunctional methylenetetrahydrofolate dehydrogenase/methenyltetrahydrofolate cyclohydrolase FolD [Steroidobacteraceae bacterium]|nr:bifunctional methylenetetrahydrofolate dehydrogenase/methenyltetrahydrofolate cyclohydrolase FolD [Steroidobacteraceae bacterium]